jgi:hypothetical protein
MVMCDAHLEQLRDNREQWIDCLDGARRPLGFVTR